MLQFSKMHGAGNDYVYVDCFEQPVPADASQLAQRVSDRHFGIGSDGLVLIVPAPSADAEMRMYNADGSRGKMCGNALRCVAWFLRNRGRCESNSVRILTGCGVVAAEIVDCRPLSGTVRVNMGRPVLEPAAIPALLPSALPQTLHVRGRSLQVTGVSMGNPHCVVICDELSDDLVLGIGPAIETHECFPARTNVEFVRVENPHELEVRVWERGSGETLACGTGACAAVVAGSLAGVCDRKANVHLPGGELAIEWQANDELRMTGPVAEVYRGTWLHD